MTKSIENEKKRIRHVPRGILTPKEREQLKKGTLSRHMKQNIKSKTYQSLIVDLPLIFDRMGLATSNFGRSHYLAFIKLYFNLIKSHMQQQRLEKGIKAKISDKMVWRQLTKELDQQYGNGIYQH
jgi:predicted RNA-binding protein YlxR (DUF448 family)